MDSMQNFEKVLIGREESFAGRIFQLYVVRFPQERRRNDERNADKAVPVPLRYRYPVLYSEY
jgi:hypothetical protein